MPSKILLGNFFQNSSMKRKKELAKTIEYFFLSIKENFVEGKESDGVWKIALGSSLWLSHRFLHVSSWSDLGILTRSYPV